MKNLLKLGVLSLALIATVFMMNTNAAPTSGQVSLQILAVSGNCQYGTSVNLGTTNVSYVEHNLTGAFTPNVRYCNDTEGSASRAITVTSTTPLTGSITSSIPASNVFVWASAANTVTSGACTAGTNIITPTSANPTAVVVVNKSGIAGQTCTVTTTGVNISVKIPASQAIGIYTGTLAINAPW